MKVKNISFVSLILLIASLVAVQQSLAQIPCGPTILPSAALFVNWSQFQYDSGHSGCNPYETILSTSTVQNLSPKWLWSEVAPFSSPVVANGFVYSSRSSNIDFPGAIFALHASKGDGGWDYTTFRNDFSSPAVGNGMVYAGATDSNLYALDAGSATLLWTYATGAPVSTPVVAGGAVFAGSEDRNLYALDAVTGALLWSYTSGGTIFSAPAVVNGVVYVSSDQLYALNANTGALIWKYPISPHSSPAVVRNVVYAGYDQVYALNASTGALIWKYPATASTTPAIANGMVYVGSGDGNIYALNASSGILTWKYAMQDDQVNSPAVANGVVYATSDQYLRALDAKTGALLSVLATGFGTSSPAVANGIVYVGSTTDGSNGRIYAFSLNGH